jgi:hypothetical protein
MSSQLLTRRTALEKLLGTTALATVASQGRGLAASPVRSALAFDDPVWNREMMARLEGDTAPGRFIYGTATGVVHGVRDGEALRPLFGFEVFSTRRVLRQADGSYQRLCRELVFYRDPVSGELLDNWDNPYSGERVRVVDIANDPFNFVISEFFPDPPSYGGLIKDRPPKRPLRLKWELVNDTVTLDSDIHLYYPNALDPARWPRESAGPMNRVSEFFRYFVRREDAEDPRITHLPHDGVWVRVTPWLPWMLMGTEPGHVLYMGRFTSVKRLGQVSAPVLARIRERFPKYLTAPETWTEPSLSSLENYARTQQPAPPAPVAAPRP